MKAACDTPLSSPAMWQVRKTGVHFELLGSQSTGLPGLFTGPEFSAETTVSGC